MIMEYLQKIGKSMMLPLSVLPAAAIIMGIGYAIDPNAIIVGASGTGHPAALFLISAGSAVLNNIPWFFAVGVAVGMSRINSGTAALSSVIAMFLIYTLLSPATIAAFTNVDESQVSAAFSHVINTFTGILSGLLSATLTNRFSEIRLPMAFSFFNGKRFVPLVTFLFTLGFVLVLLIVWPILYGGLVLFGEWMTGLGPLGAGLFGFFNRLLIPIGLHHALNSVFWFDIANINDIPNYWAGNGVKGVTGMYQAGFFPIMMFGLPGAALAMYHTARDDQRKRVAGLLFSAAFAAFFTGVTEPLEFSFMFLAPFLYIVHALLTGLSLFLAATLHATAGFSFSAGLIDFVLSSRLPMANRPWILLIMGVFAFAIYYCLFRFLILRFDIKTPGREAISPDDSQAPPPAPASKDNSLEQTARALCTALGGAGNLRTIDSCATRLRLTVRDAAIIDEPALKAAGAYGVIRPGKTAVQVVVGTQADAIAAAMRRLT